MPDLQEFCTAFGLNQAAADAVIVRAQVSPELTMPWYLRLFIGLAAWVTAIVAILFGVTLIQLVFIEAFASGMPLILTGGVYLAIGLWLIQSRVGKLFSDQFAVALGAAGVAMVALGVGILTEALAPVMLTCIALAAGVARWVGSALLQFLTSLLAVAVTAFYLLLHFEDYALTVASLATPLGLVLLFRPQPVDLRPTAIVLLLLVPILSVGQGYAVFTPGDPTGGDPQLAAGLHVLIFLWLVWLLWPRMASPAAGRSLAAFAVAAVAIALLLPPGGVAALVIMCAAFLLGSRPLALLGALLQGYFICRFYYDLQMTLLAKSLVLVAVGGVLLLLWGFVARRWSRAGAPV